MAGALFVLGIRHHGPGSARVLIRALEALQPTIVLVEGPPDAAGVIELAAHSDMKPPVALLVYDVEAPSSAVYYPFASFSPEWQALRWALNTHVPVRFIDLPQSLRERESQAAAERTDDESAPESPAPRDPLDELASAAGFADGEAWWGRLIEERHAEEDPLALFDAIRGAMTAAREGFGDTPRDRDEPAREAHMRKAIRAALKEGFERIAIVCGAWHAPVLTPDALERYKAKQDDEIIRRLTKRKTAATWIPWTHDRLCLDSGYGAGVASPGGTDHLWVHREQLSERWMVRIARLLRDEDIDASSANVIESVRLADCLAAIRGRRSAGLEELGEATLSVLCHGNPMPLRLIQRKLVVGQRLGQVPDAVPMVPLQRDLSALQKSLRLKVSGDEMVLDLDQRKDNDLARSHLLHRLRLLGVDWGELQDDQRQRGSTFHEIWRLQWRPEFAVRVIEAAQWGNTVADAASASVTHRATRAKDLGELTALVDDVILADLPDAVARLLARVQTMSAVSTDVGHLMMALPPLARVLRYGNVRKTDAALIEPVVAGLLARIAAGLLPACASLDDDAAARMRERIDGVHARGDHDQSTRLAGGVDGSVDDRRWRRHSRPGRGPRQQVAPRFAAQPGRTLWPTACRSRCPTGTTRRRRQHGSRGSCRGRGCCSCTTNVSSGSSTGGSPASAATCSNGSAPSPGGRSRRSRRANGVRLARNSSALNLLTGRLLRLQATTTIPCAADSSNRSFV